MNTENIDKYLEIGKKDKNWYQYCQTTFITLYGKERLNLVCNLFAATSIHTSLKANIKLFLKALYEIDNNLPISNYLPVIKIQIGKIRNGEDLSGRKISSFAKAMAGDPNSVVVDIWLMRAFQMKTDSPTKKNYDEIEAYIKDKASSLGVEPRQVSAMIWAGVRIEKSGDFNTHYKELLNIQTHHLFSELSDF